jgi:hypothetical protein
MPVWLTLLTAEAQREAAQIKKDLADGLRVGGRVVRAQSG